MECITFKSVDIFKKETVKTNERIRRMLNNVINLNIAFMKINYTN